MAGAHLPEEIIVEILSRLPVKSLIRFSSVSKRWRFIILFDPDFAKSQFEVSSKHKTLGHRLLLVSQRNSTTETMESLDLKTAPFGDVSLVRKLNIPFQRPGCSVSLLGSCNGLVFVYLRDHHHSFYVWNPSTGFFKELTELPGPECVCIWNKKVNAYGIGYLPATDDYKIVVTNYAQTEEGGYVQLYNMLSLREHIWKSIKAPMDSNIYYQGTLLNEALHWAKVDTDEIVAFDLAKEEFWRMRLPNFDQDGSYFSHLGVSGGCLCVSRYPIAGFCDSDFWVMKEYDVSDSWTKLFNLKFSNPLVYILHNFPFLVMESGTVAAIRTCKGATGLIKIEHKEEEKHCLYMCEDIWSHDITEYEESLFRISGCNGVEKPSQGCRKLK